MTGLQAIFHHPYGLQHNQKREDNKESFVAAVGPHDAHDGHRQQNKNKAQSGEDSWREHVELQSFVSGPLPHFMRKMAIKTFPRRLSQSSGTYKVASWSPKGC
jgi:hypothetical protein